MPSSNPLVWRKAAQKWRAAHLEEGRRRVRECYRKYRAKRLAYNHQKYQKDRTKNVMMAKEVYRYSKYGITKDDFLRMITQQNGLCAICGKFLKYPHIDHDHKTGKVRGILCPGCNAALGTMRDDPELLRRAAEYIERSVSC